ncbi:MAG TPA: DUF167 domain-containing protein [Gammaproteobacteria bacterium]|nr:DUF167 domain-containing protein [Gammaproteobacteria bacterium]
MWFKIQSQQVELRIFAKPNAKRTALIKVHDELHIALNAKPHEGEANKELICYLAKLLQLPKGHIILKRGEGSRHKVVIIPLTAEVQKFLDNPL